MDAIEEQLVVDPRAGIRVRRRDRSDGPVGEAASGRCAVLAVEHSVLRHGQPLNLQVRQTGRD